MFNYCIFSGSDPDPSCGSGSTFDCLPDRSHGRTPGLQLMLQEDMLVEGILAVVKSLQEELSCAFMLVPTSTNRFYYLPSEELKKKTNSNHVPKNEVSKQILFLIEGKVLKIALFMSKFGLTYRYRKSYLLYF